MSYSYAHMCRMDHVEIGHNDSEHEQCPLCRVLNALQDADTLYTGYGLVAEKSVDGVSPGEWISRVREILRVNGWK